MPIRIQRKRIKGWKMPENTISVTRPGQFGNPFQIGGWYKIGNGNGFGMTWTRAYEGYQDHTYTLIKTNEQAVEMFREFMKRYPLGEIQIDLLRGKNLACFCKLDQPCHADILLEIANK